MVDANPYAPPTAESLPPTLQSEGFVYQPTTSLGLALTVLLGACSLTLLANCGSLLMQIDLLERAQRGAVISIAEANANDARVGLLAGLWVLLFLGTAVTWCVWQNRTSKNVRALGAQHLEHGPNAWGWFFCPVLNLWRPMQVIAELWENTPLPEGRETWRRPEPPSLIVGLWWVPFIVGNLLSRVADKMLEQTDDLDSLISGSQLLCAGWGTFAVAGVFALLYVRLLQRRVEQRAATLTA